MRGDSNVHRLLLRTIDALRDMGLTEPTIWSAYTHVYLPIARYFEQRDLDEFDEIVVQQYAVEIKQRYDEGAYSRNTYNLHCKAIERITEVYKTGKLEWSCRLKMSKFALNERFQSILEGFIAWKPRHYNTTGDFDWVTRKYLSWLYKNGHCDVGTIKEADVRAFIYHCAEHLQFGSMRNILCYLRQFHEYLEEKGLLPIAWKPVLNVSIPRKSRLQPAFSRDELARVIEQIDRSTHVGKRDYAIILLGADLGLRAGDIADMRLEDIHWRAKEIRIVQQKTGESLSLPLQPKLRDAIAEYIIKSRPTSESKHLFLRHRSPFQKMKNGVTIGDMFKRYQDKAGIARAPFDGKGFHSLRRMLGREMAVAEVPVAMIAQVLGHSGIESTKQYISLDSEHLKICALDFGGIEPAKGGMPK